MLIRPPARATPLLNPGEGDRSPGSATVLRLVVAAVLWILRIVFGWNENGRLIQPALVLDALLVIAHVWAIRPLQSAMGRGFGVRPSWTAQLVTPLLGAAFLLCRDMWFAVRRLIL